MIFHDTGKQIDAQKHHAGSRLMDPSDAEGNGVNGHDAQFGDQL